MNAFTNAGCSLLSVALQADGRIVGVGGATTRINSSSTRTDFLVARYLGDPGSAVATASSSSQASRTTAASLDTPRLTPLETSNDHDLIQLATEVIASRPKRRKAQ